MAARGRGVAKVWYKTDIQQANALRCYQQPGRDQPNGGVDMPTIPQIAYIYALLDPRTNEVRYIGWTRNPQARLHKHVSDSAKRITHCHNWVTQLLAAGYRPLMQIIEETDFASYAERERFWIAFYRDSGARLTNHSDGGDGMPGHHHTEYTKRRMSEYAKSIGRRPLRTPEVMERIRQKMIGRKDSFEVRIRKSAGRKGMRFSEQHRAHLRQAKNEFWATSKGEDLSNRYSREYGSLSDEQVIEVWRLARARTLSQAAIAKRFNIPQSTVSEIKSGKRYKHVVRPED